MKAKNIRHILNKVKRIAAGDRNVLILGEFGTGKSWVAEQVHSLSDRSANSFHLINCQALPSSEIENKVFGYNHVNNGKTVMELGLFEKANHGVLFFKDFNGLSDYLQERILSVEKNKFMKRMNSDDIIPIDVRLISSCIINSVEDLKNNQTIDRLRKELDPAIIFCPPLRQRREDIIWLIQYFLSCNIDHKYNFMSTQISPQALLYCLRYDWPGNIKQLKNAIKHAAILAGDDAIRPEHLTKTIRTYQPDEKKLAKLRKSHSYRDIEDRLSREIKNESCSKKSITKILEYKRATLIDKMIEYHLSKSQASNLFNFMHSIIKR